MAYSGWKIRMITVAMKASPTPMDMSLRRVRSMTMSLKYVVEEERNSDVTSSIMAVIASHRPMSDIDSGKFICYSLRNWSSTVIVCPSRDTLSCCIVTVFPVFFAMAQAMALIMGLPRK